MRALYFTIAGVLSVLAIALTIFAPQGIWATVAIIVAGVFLILGFREHARHVTPAEITLTEEEAATIRQMKAEGNHSGAISQVLLWKRYATQDQAAKVVRELD